MSVPMVFARRRRAWPTLAALACGRPGKYVAPDGDDAHAGTEAAPWATIAHAVTQLQAGDTLYLRGGTYDESDIPIGVAGTAEAPIKIRNMPEERPVIDGSYPDFRRPHNALWEPYDAAKRIFRSVRSYPDAAEVRGKLEFREALYSLIAYQSYPAQGVWALDYLSSDNHNYDRHVDKSSPVPRYMGPGLAWNHTDQRIYVRLVPPTAESQHGADYNIPDRPDPRLYRIFLSSGNSGFWLQASAAHIIFSGIHLQFHQWDVAGTCRHLTFKGLTSVSNQYAFLLEAGSRSVLIEDVVMKYFMPPWIGWFDIKGGEEPAARNAAAAVAFESDVEDVEVRNCEITDFFDGLMPTGGQADLRIHHNDFTRIVDDACQLGSDVVGFEFAYNRVRGAGPSHQGSGDASAPGTKFIHHNIIDTTDVVLWNRFDPKGIRPWWLQGFLNPIVFATHDTPANDPWKIYNNTLVFPSAAWPHIQYGSWETNRSGVPHECYNNILHQPDLAAPPWGDPDCRVIIEAEVHMAAEIYDGNCYHLNARNSTPLFGEISDGATVKDIWSVADLRADPFFAVSQLTYPPGWEASGLDADPQLDSDYVPRAPGVQLGGVDLSEKQWPGVDSTYRGAIGPGRDGSVIGRQGSRARQPSLE